jgi:hypothetical protein
MPFTFAHPAAILPFLNLKKHWFSATGLIIGSVVPDFEYFIRMDDKKIYTHYWAGLIYYDLPLSIILAYLFHNIVRNPFIDNSPFFLYRRMAVFKKFYWNRYFISEWPVVLYSILIGGVSHLLWDGFTHRNRFFVKNIELLRHEIFIAGINMPLYKALQYLSSAIGLAVIAYAIYRLPERNEEKRIFRKFYWVNMFVIAATVLACRIFLNIQNLKELVVSCVASLLLALIIVPFTLRKRQC